jgi:hypothetical protein
VGVSGGDQDAPWEHLCIVIGNRRFIARSDSQLPGENRHERARQVLGDQNRQVEAARKRSEQ